MASRMRNLLKLSTRKRKAQFFVLSAFAIVSLLYIVSSWIQPYTIVDTSSIVLMKEPFVFNNLIEKAAETVNTSKSCEDLQYNLDEYRNFVQNFAPSQNLNLIFNYSISPCFLNLPGVPLPVIMRIEVQSSSTDLSNKFVTGWLNPSSMPPGSFVYCSACNA